ncbi:hypothetical protein H4R20_004017, partial [Coemansia guatemalensis]
IMDGDQFNQFVATMTALPDRQGWKFTDFKGIVSPLIPAEQKNNPKFAPDAVNWLVNANRLLTTANCPAKWKVTLAAIYIFSCDEPSSHPSLNFWRGSSQG